MIPVAFGRWRQDFKCRWGLRTRFWSFASIRDRKSRTPGFRDKTGTAKAAPSCDDGFLAPTPQVRPASRVAKILFQ